MQQDLQPLLDEFGSELELLDVDSRSDWQKEYGQLLPVLETPEGEILCHFHLDEAVVRGWLSQQGRRLCSD